MKNTSLNCKKLQQKLTIVTQNLLEILNCYISYHHKNKNFNSRQFQNKEKLRYVSILTLFVHIYVRCYKVDKLIKINKGAIWKDQKKLD